MPADTSLFWDIVSFRVLVTPAVLLVMYYLGAIAVPLLIAWFARNSVRKAKSLLDEQTLEQVRDAAAIGRTSRSGLITGSVLVFFLLELFWRMLFEFLIAYFQIHNALMGSAGI